MTAMTIPYWTQTLIAVVHWTASLVVLGNAINRLYDYQRPRNPTTTKEKMGDFLALAIWICCAVAGLSGLFRPLMNATGPDLADAALMLGVALFACRNRMLSITDKWRV